MGAEPIAAAPATQPSGHSPQRHLISGIESEATWRMNMPARELDACQWTPELWAGRLAAIVSRPPVKGGSSFQSATRRLKLLGSLRIVATG